MKLAIALGLCAAAATSAALACGHCVEDRVAAVYDYGVELRAGREDLRIAYLGIAGARAETRAAADAVAAAVAAVPAVARDTVRTSASPPACAFAAPGNDAEIADIVKTVNGRLAKTALRVELLRTWDARHGLR